MYYILTTNYHLLNGFNYSVTNIASDGQITEDERDAFYEFSEHHNKMSLAIESLKLWAKKELSE